MVRLSEKVALITGGAGGIGQAAARIFTGEGAKVVLVDRDEASLQSIVISIGEDKASYVVADVTQPEQAESYVKAAIERWGQLLQRIFRYFSFFWVFQRKNKEAGGSKYFDFAFFLSSSDSNFVKREISTETRAYIGNSNKIWHFVSVDL